MKIIKYNDIPDDSYSADEYTELKWKIITELKKHYNLDEWKWLKHAQNSIWAQLLWLMPYLKWDLNKIKFLDLWCWSTTLFIDNSVREEYRMFEPWLARWLHHLWLQVTGIDMWKWPNEKFLFQSGNLCLPNSMINIPDHSIDIAHEHMLYDSPLLSEIRYHRWIHDNITTQLQRVLKSNWVYIYHWE